VTYRRAARAWPPGELAAVYRAAADRGAKTTHLDRERLATDPVGPLSSAVPWLARLAGAVHVLHVLPEPVGDRVADGREIAANLFAAVDQAATGAVYLCDLALTGAKRGDPVADWVSYAVEQASDALPRLSYTARPPSLIAHTEEAARCLAVAIDHAHADPSAAPSAIADALGHLLVVSAITDTAYERQSGG